MMVKIRYMELPAGLHVRATRHGRRTVIYLLPGLTPAERRAALIRVRSSSRIGHGPRLPALSMALAISADRVRTYVRNGAAAMRGHPVLLLPPLILLVSTAIVFVLTSFVTLTVHGRRPVAIPSASAVIPVASAPRHHVGSGGSPGDPGPTPAVPVASGRPGSSPTATAAPTSPGTTAPESARPTASPTPVPTLSASPSPGSGLTGTPSPSPSPSSSGACVTLGPLGICLHL